MTFLFLYIFWFEVGHHSGKITIDLHNRSFDFVNYIIHLNFWGCFNSQFTSKEAPFCPKIVHINLRQIRWNDSIETFLLIRTVFSLQMKDNASNDFLFHSGLAFTRFSWMSATSPRRIALLWYQRWASFLKVFTNLFLTTLPLIFSP